MKASISQIKTFKACRRSWYFRYYEKLIPVTVSDSLETGKNYHRLLEQLENGDDLDDGFTKEYAMAAAYQKYILPKFHVIAAEKELEKEIGGHILHGFVDGLSDDGHIVEHKTTSSDISVGGEYEYNLLWDEQVLAYMLLSGLRKVHYTVCRKPTIRLKKDETDEEFYNRMVEWYDTDTDQKIRVFTVERTDEEVAQFEKEVEQILETMDVVAMNMENNPLNIYRNTCHCNSWGRRCEYSNICLNYDPAQQYIEFTKGE